MVIGAAITAFVSTIIISGMNSVADATSEYWRQYVVGASKQNQELALLKVHCDK